jgi:hypothetical protein
MFQKSIRQADLYKSAGNEMRGRTKKLYEDGKAWHNQFRERVTNKIDEEIFRPLFSAETGAPNAPIRVLAGMMIIKEGQGLSDEHLYYEGRFNLCTRSALGLMNMDDEVPVESTYYLFRQRIAEYERETGVNLMDRLFKTLTKEQCLEFGVRGKQIRMDSKLLGSNIARYNRYGIVHETVRVFYRKNKEAIQGKLKARDLAALRETVRESAGSVTYRSTKEELEKQFEEMGALAYVLIKTFKGLEGQGEYETLKRVFGEQYKIERAEGERKTIAVPREKEEISAKGVQSPHDTDCHYRNKNGREVKGYSINVTETCDEGTVNLLVDVRTKPVSVSDVAYLAPALDAASEIVPEKIEAAHTDGAYHSPENQKYCKEKCIELIIGGMQGKASKYDLDLDGDNNLIVKNKENGEVFPAVIAKTRKADAPRTWRVKDGEHAPIYFTEADVATSRLRKKTETLPKKVRDIRNNIEATIFQLGYHYRADKSRYRGLEKHEIWAISRCLWINFRRIAAWVGGMGDEIAGVLLSLHRFFLKVYPTYA